jgi:hypothetical protein
MPTPREPSYPTSRWCKARPDDFSRQSSRTPRPTPIAGRLSSRSAYCGQDHIYADVDPAGRLDRNRRHGRRDTPSMPSCFRADWTPAFSSSPNRSRWISWVAARAASWTTYNPLIAPLVSGTLSRQRFAKKFARSGRGLARSASHSERATAWPGSRA